MKRRNSDVVSILRPAQTSQRLSYCYSQCSSRSRSDSIESDVRHFERASNIALSDLDNSELLDVDDLQLLRQQNVADRRESVRVTVRFRPLFPKEQATQSAWTVHTATGTVEAAFVSGQNGRRRGVYAFDEVYDAQHSTRAIYDGLASSIVRSALDGIHGSIFAYGQTSSGKTYTMQGTGLGNRKIMPQNVETGEDRRPEDSDGLVQLAVKDLFDEMARRPDVEYFMRVSYLEVYNETVKDLLASGSAATGRRRGSIVHIREHPVTGVFTDNSERVVTDARGVLQALRDGEKQRAVGVTRMNERSSRSHSIFRLVIESKMPLGSLMPSEASNDVERVRVGYLNFVDLAGSESARAVSSGGKRLATESGNINKSLLALSRVVESLGSSKPTQQDHTNFRDSKLTRILQPSLGGAARILFICCASPASTYIEDTRSTLKFASRAKRIKVNAAVNEVFDQRAQSLMELARENQMLRQQLESLASASRDEMEKHAARLRMRVISLEAAAAASKWRSSKVMAPVYDSIYNDHADRQPEVTGLERATSPVTLEKQEKELDCFDEEDTVVDSKNTSPQNIPLMVADAVCTTCDTVDSALAIAMACETESSMRIKQLEVQLFKLKRQYEAERSKCSVVEVNEDLVDDNIQCGLNIDDDEMDETQSLSGCDESDSASLPRATSLSLASAALLAVMADKLKNQSPTEALAIVMAAFACMGIVVASLVWNIATMGNK